MTRRCSFGWILFASALGLAACGDDGNDDAGGTPTSPPPNDATTTTAPADEAEEIPASTLTTPLDQAFGVGEAFVEAGEISVHWYTDGSQYVALYTGEGIGDLPPLCPGNSITNDGAAFTDVSNAPTADGGCEGISSTFTEVRVCDAAWMYVTKIPADGEGQLFASISGPGTGAGVLGIVEAGPEVPEIDATAERYTVPAFVLAGGATELTC